MSDNVILMKSDGLQISFPEMCFCHDAYSGFVVVKHLSKQEFSLFPQNVGVDANHVEDGASSQHFFPRHPGH